MVARLGTVDEDSSALASLLLVVSQASESGAVRRSLLRHEQVLRRYLTLPAAGPTPAAVVKRQGAIAMIARFPQAHTAQVEAIVMSLLTTAREPRMMMTVQGPISSLLGVPRTWSATFKRELSAFIRANHPAMVYPCLYAAALHCRARNSMVIS